MFIFQYNYIIFVCDMNHHPYLFDNLQDITMRPLFGEYMSVNLPNGFTDVRLVRVYGNLLEISQIEICIY